MNILFNELPILQTTKDAIEQLGLIETTPIQHHAIPLMLEGKDMIGQAQTGTGKTFAFAIPILEKIDPQDPNIQALIICPTRELTLQVYKEFIKLVKFNKEIKITSIYGGESYTKQFKNLAMKPQIVVATPGRAIDHLERKTIDFSNLKVLVMDEADEMLKMGFQEDLEKLLKDTPQTRQTALFSATMPDFIKKVAKKYQKTPEIIKIETPTLTVSKTDQFYYMVKKSDRDQLLIRLLDFYEPSSAIIFCNTKMDVDALAQFMQKQHYEADAIHGDLKQSQRDYVMARFRSKKLKFLIATDVAARGLDISHVDMVINYELPFEDEVYVHRIGRTGRAGKSGISISLVYPSMRGKLHMIEKFIKTEMKELQIPSEDDIHLRRKERNYLDLSTIIDENNDMHDELIQRLLHDGYEANQIIAALLSKITPEKRTYEAIEAPATKKKERDMGRKVNTNDSRRESKRPGGFKVALINLGKEDGIKPARLVDFFKSNIDLYPKNIGDIIIYPKETEFQIHPLGLKRLSELNNKFYNGKKIKITVLNK